MALTMKLELNNVRLSKDTKSITFEFKYNLTGNLYRLEISNPYHYSHMCKSSWYEYDEKEDEYIILPKFADAGMRYCYVGDGYFLTYRKAESFDDYLDRLTMLINLRLSGDIAPFLNMAEHYNIGNIDEFNEYFESMERVIDNEARYLLKDVDSDNITGKVNTIIWYLHNIPF